MREICIELDPELVETLEAEGDQIGVSSAAEYCEWLVEHRDALPESPDRDHLLEAYRERFVEMKRELEAARSEADAPPEPDQAASSAPSEADDAVTTQSPSPAPSESADVTPSEPIPSEADDRTPTEPAQAAGPTTATPSRQAVEAKTDGGQAVAATSSSFELQGSPRTTVSNRPAEDSSEQSSGGDHTQSTLEDQSAEFNSVNLQPERVKRIEGDPVAEDATVLGSVETDRMDELSRRAVAKTRKTLNRSVETGLEYSSSTDLSNSSIPLGEDIVDIECLSVPARSDDTAAQRREVAGRAVAFLRDERRAQKSDFVAALYEDFPAGYDSADSWWRFVKQALEQVESVDGGSGSRIWTYSG